MSRFEMSNKNIELAWGYDHACGYFVQIYKDFDIVIDDEQFNLFSSKNKVYKWPQRIFDVANKYGFEIDKEKVIAEENPKLMREWMDSPSGRMIIKMSENT